MATDQSKADDGGARPAEGGPGGVLDSFGRPLRDLRISVTDRCNFRCLYCMPKECFGPGHQFLPRSDLLTFEEIERLARIFAGLGVEKFRLTGGEPLLRSGIENLVRLLAGVPGTEVVLTTNASLLAAKAQALADAGLARVTVSLDALDDPTFSRMNDVGFPVAKVLAGIDAAARVGLAPVKVNMVVQRGMNDHCILPMAEYFRGSGHILRFIEYMDVGTTNGWRLDDVVPSAEVIERIAEAFPLEPVGANYTGEVANRYRYADGAGEVGVISSVTSPFCGGCTRLRLSADGSLYTCLFATGGHDVRWLLREGAPDETVRRMIVGTWARRDDRYSEQRTALTPNLVAPGAERVEMSYIGG